MGTEQNKQLASQFFARLTANDLAGALELVADDATWWIPGKPGALPAAGTHTKHGITRIIQTMVEQLKSGLRMTVKSAIAEGDRVALEVESYGELRNGRVYNQEYHVLMTMRAGKITAVREYLDTQHAFAIWFAP